MSFDIHPILDAGHLPLKSTWYAIRPEGEGEGDAGETNLSGPCPRLGACADFIQEGEGCGSVLVSAGATPDGPYSDLHKLSFKKDSIEWISLSKNGFPARYEHASFVTSSSPGNYEHLYIFAGARQDGSVCDVWKYSLANNKWKEVDIQGQVPNPRTYHSSSSTSIDPNGLVVFSGGDSGTDPVRDQRVHLFDAKSSIWSSPETSGSPPSPRQGHVIAVVGKKFFVHGGMAGTQILDDLHCLDLVTFEWTSPQAYGCPPPPLAAHGCAVIGDLVYIFGGLSSIGPAAQDGLYCLHTDTLTWKTITCNGPSPPARLDHAMCSIMLPVPSPAETTPQQDSTKHSKGGPPSSVSAAGLEEREEDAENSSPILRHSSVEEKEIKTIPQGSEYKSSEAVVEDTKAIIPPSKPCQKASSNAAAVDERDTQTPLQDGGSVAEPTATDSPGSFRAVSIINPDDPGELGYSPLESSTTSNSPAATITSDHKETPLESSATTPDTRETLTTNDAISDIPRRWLPALFLFGGVDTFGNVHGDSFIFVP